MKALHMLTDSHELVLEVKYPTRVISQAPPTVGGGCGLRCHPHRMDATPAESSMPMILNQVCS